WGGLVPPLTSAAVSSISVWHFILSAGYMGMVALLVSPCFYLLIVRRRVLIASLPFGAASLALFVGTPTVPLRSILEAENPAIANLVAYAFTIVVSFSCLSFLIAMGDHLW